MSENIVSRSESSSKEPVLNQPGLDLTPFLKTAVLVGHNLRNHVRLAIPAGLLAAGAGVTSGETSVAVAGLLIAGAASFGRLISIDRANQTSKKSETQSSTNYSDTLINKPQAYHPAPSVNSEIPTVSAVVLDAEHQVSVLPSDINPQDKREFKIPGLARVLALGIMGLTTVTGVAQAVSTKTGERVPQTPDKIIVTGQFGVFSIEDPSLFNRSVPEEGVLDSQSGQIIPKEDLISIFDLSERLWAKHMAKINVDQPDYIEKLENLKRQFTPDQAKVYGALINGMIELIEKESSKVNRDQNKTDPFLEDDRTLAIWYREDKKNPNDRVLFVSPNFVITAFNKFAAKAFSTNP